MDDSGSSQSVKIMAGEKRRYAEIDEKMELGSRSAKGGDLDPVFCSEEWREREVVHPMGDAATRMLDLNANVGADSNVLGDDVLSCVKEINKVPSFERQDMKRDFDSLKSRRFGLDLNAEDVSSSINHESFQSYKNYEHLKSRDDSECGSSVGPLEEKDPMRMWKEMKQNGFLSSSHGGVPMPKPRLRKTKSDGIKKKMEIAKKEQVDRFAKIAAPSGLLNGLNPGIINHVRNSKQVHSIIEALVKSEKLESRHTGNKPGSQTKSSTREFTQRKSEPRNMHDSGVNIFSQEDGSLNTYAGGGQVSGYPELTNRSVSEQTGGDGDSCTVEPHISGRTTCPSQFSSNFEDDILALKLSSSSRIVSENISSLTNEESANVTCMTSLSVKAANVASQWLELLNQDIKGRLTALRRSKKRVRAVIHTELPSLVSREFLSCQENDPHMTRVSVSHSNNAVAEAHRTRWGTLFHQMDNALSEEERELERWWNQVKEMQLHCERGLFKYSATNGLPQMDRLDNDCRSENADNLDRDLAIRAAAASIYSTCNFLSSMENLPCC